MKEREYLYLVGDFETTVFNGQEYTEVWAAGVVEMYTENVMIYHSIDELYNYLLSLKRNIIIYFHNLKFDGEFWLYYLMNTLKYKQAYEIIDKEKFSVRFMKTKDMPSNSFKYSISDRGMWYNITIKTHKHVIEIRDSLKLLPFSVKHIGDSFKTKHRKLEMEYEGVRYAGCEITDTEKEYIANDILVVKEALEIMFDEGHNSLTIGSCCLKEYKKLTGKEDYDMFFPNLYDIKTPEYITTFDTAGDYIFKSYRGGWCYVVTGKMGKVVYNGCTLDVNSLYPSMMSSESGNRYPVGKPNFWKGNFIIEEALKPKRYYFIRIKTRFYLKPGKLPFIQIKNSHLYKATENLESSDVVNPNTGECTSKYLDFDGKVKSTSVELVLSMTDYKLIKEHYDLVDFTIIDGCWFFTEIGLFDDYINKYKTLKQTSTGAKREQAKLFLNNLYGKMASTTDSSFKVAYQKETGETGFIRCLENNKIPGYIAVGSAITSYARNFTIRTAQKNYMGPDEPGFIYADTDSIHCDKPAHSINGVTVHESDFCCWKVESCWDKAFFTRQKTYIEHITHENMNELKKPYYSIKCAGMPKKCKDLLEKTLVGFNPDEEDKEYSEEEIEFLSVKRTLEDFVLGLEVPGKLIPKRIKGGVVLKETTYRMR